MVVNYEFLGDEPIENLITCMNFKIDKAVFFGYHDSIEKQRKTTEKFLKMFCGVKSVVFHALSQNNLQSTLSTMSKEIEHERSQNNQIYFDITGGESLILVAFGMLSKEFETPIHIYDIVNDKLIEMGENTKSNLSENYFFKSVRSIPLKYLLLVVTAAGIPLLIIIVFQFINFSIFIPSKYIPYDNIFDVPYYFSKIIEQTNIIHSLSLTGNTYCFDLYHNSFNMLSALMTAFVMIYSVLFVIINGFVNKCFKEHLFSGD